MSINSNNFHIVLTENKTGKGQFLMEECELCQEEKKLTKKWKNKT